MYLKGLTINGFKSFARKGELEFSTPITAIVGPNGSGKSNIAEAFRFVLGEQSIKSMRGKKGEDLIFNGSESISRANRASVAITLDNVPKNGNRVFPIEFDQISIERVVHRDGTNEYAINGSKSRLKDVQELLAAANVGPTGHHIISQGEADRILSANLHERREMIEDALGLKIFQFKKAESERKLKKTLENITQVESLRREVAPHLKFLEKQIKKIERSVALQEELKHAYAEYLKREDIYIAYHQDTSTAVRHELQKSLDTLTQKITHAKGRLLTEEQDKYREKRIALENDITQTQHSRGEIVRHMGQLEGQILLLERQIDTLKEKQKGEENTPIPRAEFVKVVTKIEQSSEEVLRDGDIKNITHAVRSIVHTLKTLLAHSFSIDNTEIRAIEHELASVHKQKVHLEKDVEDIERKEGQLSTEYSTLKQSIELEYTQNRDAERAIFSLMSEQREVTKKIEDTDRELRVLERDRLEFKSEFQEAGALLGRGAGMYFEYVVVDSQGNEVNKEGIICENREAQHTRKRELERMKIRLEELGTGSNEEILKEYKEAKERDEFLVHEVADLNSSVEKLRALIEELTVNLNKQFASGIEKIGIEFSKFFILMFGGGSAELLRVAPKISKRKESESSTTEGIEEDEEVSGEKEEGIEIDIRLPNKRVHGLDMLSGGERALTSIALIFAMSQVNPPLFVILDETDAALDEANSRRYGDMISALAEKSQLILITHNRETMGRAGVLYGITMAGDGVSKLLSVKFDEALAVAK